MLKQAIRHYLDIRNYDKPLEEAQKNWAAQTAKLEAELWKHRHLLQKRAVTTCPVCTKVLKLWPLETEAYYTRDSKQGQVKAYHVACYNKVV